MAHDVFISYSSINKDAADKVCSILEQKGIPCWMAPRDITPGVSFAEAIIDAIKESKVFILVYSQNSNHSSQVYKEVDRAVHHGLAVVTLRLEDVPMSKQLEYYISDVHWLDAMTPPLEQHINRLSSVVKMLMSKDEVKDDDIEKAIRKGTLRLGRTGKPGSGAGRYRSSWKGAVAAAAVLMALLVAVLLVIPRLSKQMDKSVAVLPFTNLSGDPDQEYFSDGMMDEILDRLFKIGDLKVISRTSSMRYKNTGLSVKEIARELGVRAILEGSVRRAGNLVRITVQLIDARNDTHLWSEVYDGDLSDLSNIFATQSDVAQSVARELKAVISPGEKRLIEKIPDTDLEVYDEYLKARSYWGDLSRESLNKALEYLNSAVKKDPGWAPLYAGLVQVWWGIIQMGWESPSVVSPKIYENLNKALELDPDLPEAHYLNAVIAEWMEWNWEKSEKEFLRALAINPNDVYSRMMYAYLLCILQRTDEALTQGKLALDLDPLNPIMMCWYGQILVGSGDCKGGMTYAEKVLAVDPKHLVANNVLTLAAYQCKDYEKVFKADINYYRTYPEIIGENALKGIEKIYHDQGFSAAYEELAHRIEKFASDKPELSLQVAGAYICANKPDKAMDWIEKAYENHDPNLPMIATRMFIYGPLFNNPRFVEIVKKMNLPLPED